MKAADTWKPGEFGIERRPSLDGSAVWRILDARVDPIRVVVANVFSAKPTQVLLIECDHMIDLIDVVTCPEKIVSLSKTR